MSSAYVFLNTQVRNAGVLSWIGDFGLTPFRYLFRGKTIEVETNADRSIVRIHHVLSFHAKGAEHHSKSGTLQSSPVGMIRTVLAVFTLIPGFLLSSLKVVAYLFSDVRKTHKTVQKRFQPIDRAIGTPEEPIQTTKELENALQQEILKGEGHPIRTLLVYGNSSVKIDASLANEFNLLRPKRLIFTDCKMSRQDSLKKALFSPKWLPDFDDTNECQETKVDSVDEALEQSAPLRSYFPFRKPYRTLFIVGS